MPRSNGTGPLGYGPRSGRGFGPCGGGLGRAGAGRGLGWRRFWGYYPGPALSKKEESEILAEEESILEEELKNIKSRLAELKAKSNK